MKRLINVKNNDNKCFLRHPQRILKADKNMVNDLGYEYIEFSVSGKDFRKNEKMH